MSVLAPLDSRYSPACPRCRGTGRWCQQAILGNKLRLTYGFGCKCSEVTAITIELE
jgi:hypothetical protein